MKLRHGQRGLGGFANELYTWGAERCSRRKFTPGSQPDWPETQLSLIMRTHPRSMPPLQPAHTIIIRSNASETCKLAETGCGPWGAPEQSERPAPHTLLRTHSPGKRGRGQAILPQIGGAHALRAPAVVMPLFFLFFIFFISSPACPCFAISVVGGAVMVTPRPLTRAVDIRALMPGKEIKRYEACPARRLSQAPAREPSRWPMPTTRQKQPSDLRPGGNRRTQCAPENPRWGRGGEGVNVAR